MSLHHSPSIVTNGLLVNLDASKWKSVAGRRSLCTWDTWTPDGLPSSGVTGYNLISANTNNDRSISVDPFGNDNVIWIAYTAGTNAADGGYNTDTHAIDRNKLYRFSGWFFRYGSNTNAQFYFGCQSDDAGASYAVVDLADNINETNPYFHYGGISNLSNTVWYLFVGHVFPYNYSGGMTRHPESGYYSISGGRLGAYIGGNIADAKWTPGTTAAALRQFMYYGTNTFASIGLFQPRIDVCDGTEPTIQDLLNDAGNNWRDLVGANKGLIRNATYNSSGYFNFANDNCIIDLGATFNRTYENMSLLAWVKPTTDVGDDYRAIWQGTSTGDAAFYLHRNGGVWKPYLYPDSEATGITVPDNTWSQVGFLCNSSNIYHVFNGALTSAGAGATTARTLAYFHVSGDSTTDIENFDGDIASVQFYDRMLSSDEVLQNYNATKGRFGL